MGYSDCCEGGKAFNLAKIKAYLNNKFSWNKISMNKVKKNRAYYKLKTFSTIYY